MNHHTLLEFMSTPLQSSDLAIYNSPTSQETQPSAQPGGDVVDQVTPITTSQEYGDDNGDDDVMKLFQKFKQFLELNADLIPNGGTDQFNNDEIDDMSVCQQCNSDVCECGKECECVGDCVCGEGNTPYEFDDDDGAEFDDDGADFDDDGTEFDHTEDQGWVQDADGEFDDDGSDAGGAEFDDTEFGDTEDQGWVQDADGESDKKDDRRWDEEEEEEEDIVGDLPPEVGVDDEQDDLDRLEYQEKEDVEGDPNRQGYIRTVRGAHLVYKREMGNGLFDELWVYNIGTDSSHNADKIKQKILSGTDIHVNQLKSKDLLQSYELWSVGNGQMLHIRGLPN